MNEMQQNENFSKIVKTWQVNDLIGKIMLIVETMGLQKAQEESAKSLIKQSIWTEFNQGIYISDDSIAFATKENETNGFKNLTQ